jgi:hypothetical protein
MLPTAECQLGGCLAAVGQFLSSFVLASSGSCFCDAGFWESLERSLSADSPRSVLLYRLSVWAVVTPLVLGDCACMIAAVSRGAHPVCAAATVQPSFIFITVQAHPHATLEEATNWGVRPDRSTVLCKDALGCCVALPAAPHCKQTVSWKKRLGSVAMAASHTASKPNSCQAVPGVQSASANCLFWPLGWGFSCFLCAVRCVGVSTACQCAVWCVGYLRVSDVFVSAW